MHRSGHATNAGNDDLDNRSDAEICGGGSDCDEHDHDDTRDGRILADARYVAARSAPLPGKDAAAEGGVNFLEVRFSRDGAEAQLRVREVHVDDAGHELLPERLV